jgi:ribosomal protein S18 acetylase RimI-like enzyme
MKSESSVAFDIRPAQLNDADMLSELGGTTFYHTFRPYNTEEDITQYIAKAYAPQVISENLSNRSIAYYVAFHQQKPVGYIKLIHHASYGLVTERAVELEKIYILSDYFGSGLAQQLMNQAVLHGKEQGFKTLFLGVWQENERAVNFYKKNGFEVFDTRQFQLGNRLCDDYMMKRDL